MKPATQNKSSTLLALCPGTTGDLARAIDSTFRVTDPMLSLAVAFSVGGAVRSGRIKYKGCHANAYHAIIGPTGIGKTVAQNYAFTALIEAGLGDMLAGDFTSEAALISRLCTHPITLATFDELGLALQNMAEDRGGNRREVFACMLRAFSATNGVLLGKHYSPRTGASTQMSAAAPLLSIVGSSTPSSFFAGMTARAATDGLLGRFFCWFAGNLDPTAKERNRNEFILPVGVVAEYTGFATLKSGLTRPETQEARFADEPTVAFILESLERDIRLEQNEARRALIARGPELFLKLALALCDEHFHISAEAVCFAQELLEYLYTEAWDKCGDAIGRSKQEDQQLRLREKILQVIPIGRENAITRGAITRRTQSIKSADRKSILQDLIESDDVIEHEYYVDEISSRKASVFYRPG
jgi:hypothetical protein